MDGPFVELIISMTGPFLNLTEGRVVNLMKAISVKTTVWQRNFLL